LVVSLGSTIRPEVSSFEETSEWFLEPIQSLHSLARFPGGISRLFLKVEDLFHVLPGEGATGIGG